MPTSPTATWPVRCIPRGQPLDRHPPDRGVVADRLVFRAPVVVHCSPRVLAVARVLAVVQRPPVAPAQPRDDLRGPPLGQGRDTGPRSRVNTSRSGAAPAHDPARVGRRGGPRDLVVCLRHARSALDTRAVAPAPQSRPMRTDTAPAKYAPGQKPGPSSPCALRRSRHPRSRVCARRAQDHLARDDARGHSRADVARYATRQQVAGPRRQARAAAEAAVRT